MAAPTMPPSTKAAAAAAVHVREVSGRAPQVYLRASASADAAEALLKAARAADPGRPFRLGDVLFLCAAHAVDAVPAVNQVFNGERVVRLPHVVVSCRGATGGHGGGGGGGGGAAAPPLPPPRRRPCSRARAAGPPSAEVARAREPARPRAARR